MGRQFEVRVEALTEAAFAPYGRAIFPPSTPAPKTGEDWDCWFRLGRLAGNNLQVGIVKTRPTSGMVTAMEREDHVEFLIPISGPVVQAVGLPGDLNDYTEHPRAETVRAFLIEPGQAIIMSPGTWHCAALPVEDETLYYFITQPRPPEPGRGPSPWIPFAGGDSVHVLQGS